jgi:hypothetical protein
MIKKLCNPEPSLPCEFCGFCSGVTEDYVLMGWDRTLHNTQLRGSVSQKNGISIRRPVTIVRHWALS